MILARWLALAALVATLAACARAPETPDLVFPSEVIRVTGRSAQPVHSLSVGQLEPAPLETTSPTLPIPSPMGVFTPVRVTAEATPRAAALEPRLAAMLAREEARMAALAEAAETIETLEARGDVIRDDAGGSVEDQLLSHLLVWEGQGGVRAELIWSPLDQTPAMAPSPAQSSESAPPESVPHLGDQERRALEEEAEAQARQNLRALLAETEIHPGVSLRAWLLDRNVSDREFDQLLLQANVARRDHWRDSERNLDVCEVEVRFDYGLLNSLR